MTRIFLAALLVSPLFLTACGGEWESVQVNQPRTAGGIVSYVRAKMLPAQELKLEPVLGAVDEKHSKAVEQMQEMFREQQQK